LKIEPISDWQENPQISAFRAFFPAKFGQESATKSVQKLSNQRKGRYFVGNWDSEQSSVVVLSHPKQDAGERMARQRAIEGTVIVEKQGEKYRIGAFVAGSTSKAPTPWTAVAKYKFQAFTTPLQQSEPPAPKGINVTPAPVTQSSVGKYLGDRKKEHIAKADVKGALELFADKLGLTLSPEPTNPP
jgi:hypothetical protein